MQADAREVRILTPRGWVVRKVPESVHLPFDALTASGEDAALEDAD